jgi:hypothetical protein
MNATGRPCWKIVLNGPGSPWPRTRGLTPGMTGGGIVHLAEHLPAEPHVVIVESVGVSR